MVWFLLLCVSFLTMANSFDWQGHRGARGLYPENTIGAMKEALKYPIKTLELDVVISKDHKVVVSHEPWIDEEYCLGAHNNLYALTYDEIKTYDCGSKSHPRFKEQKKIKEYKPLLSDLIVTIENELASRGLSRNYNIEIKSTPEDEKTGRQPDYQKFSELVVTEIQKHLPANRFMIQSFDWRVLKYLHARYPHLELVALREDKYTPEKVLKELGFSPAVFSPYFKLLKPSDIKFFHQKRIKVIPWTINQLEDMKKLISMGVDGIITDYPNLILNLPTDSKGEFVPDCFKGENRFEGKCVKIPDHALASPNPPGWVCKKGYVQKRFSCSKIRIPRHAEFSSDGKTWLCKEGYERYRGKCRRANK